MFLTAFSTSSCSDVGLSDKMSVVVEISRSLLETAEIWSFVHNLFLNNFAAFYLVEPPLENSCCQSTTLMCDTARPCLLLIRLRCNCSEAARKADRTRIKFVNLAAGNWEFATYNPELPISYRPLQHIVLIKFPNSAGTLSWHRSAICRQGVLQMARNFLVK